MYRKLFSLTAAIVISFILVPGISFTATPFYEGKIVRIIVGMSAGGGYDAYARAIGRHMGKHIPGHPTVLVENMPGAGSLVAANHLFKVAKPDGLTMGHIMGGLFICQAMDRPGIEFDARKFAYVGVPVKEYDVVILSKASGVTTVDKWINSKTPMRIGSTGGAGVDSSANVALILDAISGLPVRVIAGYKGTAEIRLAVESGELDGACPSWDSVRATWTKALETGNVVVMLQASPNPLPGLSNVPLISDFAKTDEARQLVNIGIHNPGFFARAFVLPPGSPNERVEILRHAFQATMKDSEFLAEVTKAKMSIDPGTGEELEKAVAEVFSLDPILLSKLKKILFK